jgi:hypothetical protein
MGLQFILMGLLAELMIRIYHESQDKPTYVVRDYAGSRADSLRRPRRWEETLGLVAAGPGRERT